MSTEINAPIRSVTVYTYNARVTRSAEIDLQAGETVLIVPGLPAQMEKESVRVSGKGAGITIRGVDIKADVLEGAESSKPLREQLKQLEREKQAMFHRQQAIDEQLAYFKALKTQSSEESGNALLKEETSFERVTAIATYIREQLTQLYAEERDLRIEQEELDEKLDALKLRVARGELADIQAGQAIHIALNAEQAMTFTCELDYMVKGAFWEPLYDLRLLDDNSVELTYMAQITQATGEDWDDVQLALSTARPALTNRLPEAKAWYVSNRRSRFAQTSYALDDRLAEFSDADFVLSDAKSSNQSPISMLAGMMPGLTSPPRLQQAAVQQATVESSSSGAVVTYSVGTPITIPGNGEPHKTTITITGLQAELDYVTVPRIAQEAYLRATITNTSEYTILPGAASIFHGNDFVGKTTLDTISPTEEFEVQLGVDDRIKVERELLTRDTGKNMIGTRQTLYYRYAVTITNLLQKPTKITVQDGYPLASISDIKVKLENVSPPADEETDLHILTWELALPDEKPRSIELAFTVEHGRNQTVHGLDD